MDASLSANTMQTCRLRAGAFMAGRPVAKRLQLSKRLTARAAHTDGPHKVAACTRLDSVTKREAMLAAAALTALTAPPWCACSCTHRKLCTTQVLLNASSLEPAICGDMDS